MTASLDGVDIAALALIVTALANLGRIERWLQRRRTR